MDRALATTRHVPSIKLMRWPRIKIQLPELTTHPFCIHGHVTASRYADIMLIEFWIETDFFFVDSSDEKSLTPTEFEPAHERNSVSFTLYTPNSWPSKPHAEDVPTFCLNSFRVDHFYTCRNLPSWIVEIEGQKALNVWNSLNEASLY